MKYEIRITQHRKLPSDITYNKIIIKYDTYNEAKKSIELYITDNSIFYEIFQIEDYGYTHCIEYKNIKSEKWNLNIWKNSFNSKGIHLITSGGYIKMTKQDLLKFAILNPNNGIFYDINKDDTIWCVCNEKTYNYIKNIKQ